MILNYFKQFFNLFADYKKGFIKYSILSIIAAFMELFGVVLTYPFVIKLLSVQNNETKKITILVGITITALFLLKNFFMIAFTYIQTKFKNKFEIMIKKRLINFFLNSDYRENSKISFSEKNKIFNLLIPNITNNFILRLLNLNINILIFILISLCIAIKFPLATALSFTCVIILIIVQDKLYKPALLKISQEVSRLNLLNNQSFNEAMLNIKNIKIAKKENYFYKKYASSLTDYSECDIKRTFLTSIPPYIIEPMAIMFLFILLTVIAIQNVGATDKLIASFALVATSIFRITPAISRIQVNLNNISSALPIVKEFLDIYQKYDIKNVQEAQEITYDKFNNYIEFKNVCFGYEKNKEVLHNINFKINKGEFIGIAGLSGTGKTTLIDILSGLYKPDSGLILIDGQNYNNYLKIGYIPQEFSLISGSIRENVAFGSKDIDDTRIINSLKMAQIYDFIEKNYKDGIYAKPFTDSQGFSQGQKQRIAIARALYSEPDILILDEATSSLDLKTEDEICNVLNELKGDKTIIVIAHRLSTIKSADKILYMEDGEIADFDTFKNLMNKSRGFNELVNLAFGGKK